MDEEERQKYIRLRRRLNIIKYYVNSLDKTTNKLYRELKEGFLIDKEVAGKDVISDISKKIDNNKESINTTISIINNKI